MDQHWTSNDWLVSTWDTYCRLWCAHSRSSWPRPLRYKTGGVTADPIPPGWPVGSPPVPPSPLPWGSPLGARLLPLRERWTRCVLQTSLWIHLLVSHTQSRYWPLHWALQPRKPLHRCQFHSCDGTRHTAKKRPLPVDGFHRRSFSSPHRDSYEI